MTTLYLMTGHPLTDADQDVLGPLKEEQWPFASLTINYDDGWLRFEPGERLGKELFKLIAQKVMTWKRGEQKFAGPWTPEREDFFCEYFGVEMELDDTDLLELAYQRADHYQNWSDNAHQRSQAAHARADEIAKYIPFGQPILVGHHSEGRHRRDLKRIRSSMDTSIAENRRAEKWQGRAETTVRHAAARYGRVKLSRRINEIEKARRTMELRLDKQLAGGVNTTHTERWIAYYNGRLEVAYQLYQETGGNTADTLNPNTVEAEVGGAVFALGSWYPVIRVNKKTVTIGYWLGVPSMTYLMEKGKITKAMTKTEWEQAKSRAFVHGGGLSLKGGE